MRLLFVDERIEYSCAASYGLDLASSLLGDGEEVRLVTTGGDLIRKFRERGVETYRAKFNLFSFRKLIEFLQEYDPHLIHVLSLPSARMGAKIARRLETPFIVTVHRRPPGRVPSLESSLLGGVIALNEVIREALVNVQNLAKSRIRVIRRGVDLRRLRSPRPGEGEAGSAAEDAGERIPVVGSVGRLSPEKGHQFLISAARMVLDRGVEAHFAIVGEGPEEARLREQVKRLDLLHHVTFSPHLPDPADLYSLFDIVALPVLRSGVGVTALEAMALGKPLVASAVGEMLQLVEDGTTGLLTPEGNAEALADRIVELISSPQRMARIGAEGRRWVEENFALQPMIVSTRAYYEEVLASLREEQELGEV